jgi:hypothetical protein
MNGAFTRHHETGLNDSCLYVIPGVFKESLWKPLGIVRNG